MAILVYPRQSLSVRPPLLALGRLPGYLLIRRTRHSRVAGLVSFPSAVRKVDPRRYDTRL